MQSAEELIAHAAATESMSMFRLGTTVIFIDSSL